MYETVFNNLKKNDIEIDPIQSQLIKEMCNYENKDKSFFSKFKKDKLEIKSFYVWGDVGRGKTLITNTFLSLLKYKIASYHYIDFMEYIHSELTAMNSMEKPLNYVAKSISLKYKIIFIDEFQVEDITDAMLVGDLINQLIRLGVIFYLTSNSHPDELYKDGLQRDKFIADMAVIHQHFNIFNLNGPIDYRTRNIVNIDLNKNNQIYKDDDITKIVKKNYHNINFIKKRFIINSREYSCKAFSSDFLWISFKDFFKEPNGNSEYIKLSKKNEWIFINDFQKCNDSSIDIIRRFISFIDICYRDKTKIKFFFDDCFCEDLYTGKKLRALWDRCYSRLIEMQTSSYIT